MTSLFRPLWQRLSCGPRERQALVFLRMATGAFFLSFGLMKLNNPHMTAILALLVRTWAEHHPQPVYQAFLQTVVLPNADFFVRFVTFSEIFIGLSYLLGGWVRYASVLGLFLNFNFLLASQHMSADALGINIAYLSIHATLGWSRSGKTFGVDSLLSRSQSSNKGKSSKLPSKRLKSRTDKTILAQSSGSSGTSTATAPKAKKGRNKIKTQDAIQAAVSKPTPRPMPEPQTSKVIPQESHEATTPSVISPKIRDLRD